MLQCRFINKWLLIIFEMDNIKALLKDLESGSYEETREAPSKPEYASLDNVHYLNQNERKILVNSTEITEEQTGSKYSIFGSEIHKTLKESKQKKTELDGRSHIWEMLVPEKGHELSAAKSAVQRNVDVYCEPIFGLRIINPLASTQLIQSMMIGKQPVAVSNIAYHLKCGDKNVDWVFAGVVVFRSGLKMSQKGSQYCLWKISDLKHDLKQVTVYIFCKAGSDMLKISVGTVVAILNASPFHKDEVVSKVDLTLTVKNSDQVMIWGASKDYGICRAMKKNGENCMAFVNKSRCNFCIFHVKSEYNKFSSKRSFQQFSSSGGFNELRNKVLNKSEVFYGGKSYTAVKTPRRSNKIRKQDDGLLDMLHSNPAKKNSRLIESDNQRLQSLSEKSKITFSNKIDDNGHGVFSNKPNQKSSIPHVTSSRLNILKQAGERMIKTGEVTRISLLPEKMKVYSSFSTVFSSKNAPEVTQLIKPEISNDIIRNGFKTEGVKISTDRMCIRGPTTTPKIIDRKNTTLQLENHEDHFSETAPKTLSLLPNFTCNDVEFELDVLKPNTKYMEKVSNISLDGDIEFELDVPSSVSKANKVPRTETRASNSFQKWTSMFPNSLKVLTKDTGVKPLLEKSISENIPEITQLTIKKYCSKASTTYEPTSQVGETAPKLSHSVTKRRSKTGLITKENINCNSPMASDLTAGNSSLGTISQVKSSLISLNIHNKKKIMTKINAIDLIKRKGGLTKINPNQVKSPLHSRTSLKRKFEGEENSTYEEKSILSQRFIDLMNTSSRHADLVQITEDMDRQNYFNKMEKKEQLEEKMLSTFKVPCKAVTCLQCKYKWFSASDLCRAEHHPLIVIDTFKRFFKCSNCTNRTVSLEIIPLMNCKNCGSLNWSRAPMIRERIVGANNSLCIRGDEQKFLESHSGTIHLNLLVPEN